MKKLIIPDPIKLGIKDLEDKEKALLEEFEKLILENVIFDKTSQWVNIEIGCGTNFYFNTDYGHYFYFKYESNEKVKSIYIENDSGDIKKFGEMHSTIKENRQILIDHLWKQIIKYFDLRLRLIFINRNNPWTFEK